MSISYVLDTTILMQAVLEESETKRVQTLFYQAAQSKNVELHIPDFTLVECVNVLWKRIRFHGETIEDARSRIHDLRAFPLSIHASAGLLPDALEIAVATNLAVYDCVHIALAHKMKYPLITADRRQAGAAQSSRVILKPITDFPEYSGEQN